MNDYGTGTGKKESADFWTLIKMFAGGILILVILAGIVSVVISFAENTSATDTTNSGGSGTGGAGTGTDVVVVKTKGSDPIYVDDDEWNNGQYYSNEYHPIDNIPKAIRIWDDGSNGYSNMYITNLREENGKIKFCVENHKKSGSGYVGTIRVYTKTWGETTADKFTDVVVKPGKEQCFETRDIGILRGIGSNEQIKFKIS